MKPEKIEAIIKKGKKHLFDLTPYDIDTLIQTAQDHIKLKEKHTKLQKGENDWWQKRWVTKDTGKQLFEIRKKWLTAYECAENWMKMYEEVRDKYIKLKKEIADKNVDTNQ